MPRLNRHFGVIERCAALYRAKNLAGSGIGPNDHPYLFYICRHQGVSQETLVRELYFDKSTVTRRIAHLEERGFLYREPDESDHRVMLVYPTEKALAFLPRLRQIAKDWEALLTEGLTPEETEAFLSLSAKVFENAKNTVKESDV